MDLTPILPGWHLALLPAWTWAGVATTWVELLGAALGLGMVIQNLRRRCSAWPLAFASSVLYGLLFLQVGLLGEAALQLVFMALAVQGARQWRAAARATGDGQWAVLRLNLQHRCLALLGWLGLGWPVLTWALAQTGAADVPVWDALLTAGSVLGQWLLGRRLIENWWIWAVVNAGSVVLFWHKALWPTAVLYAAFAALSLLGAWQWRRQVSSHPAHTA